MRSLFICLTMLLVVASVGTASSQKKAKIEFAETVHDFGTFSIDMKSVSCKFKFTNIGNAPLVIVRATASCGCTKPVYPEEPIGPGKSGEIEVTYHADQAGAFQKSVTIYSSAEPARVTLIVRGTVMESRESRNAAYPYQMGHLLLKGTHIPFYNMSNTQVKTERIRVANDADEPLTLHFAEVPDDLIVTTLPSEIPAQGEGEIIVTCKPALVKDWGLRNDQFYIKFDKNEKIDPSNRITTSVDIREDFGEMSGEELLKAPVVSLSEQKFDFDRITGRKSVEKTIQVTNTGKSTLVIRKIDPVANFTTVEISKRSIPVGKSAELTVTVDPAKIPDGVLNSRITLISNAPASPVMNIRVTGVVKN